MVARYFLQTDWHVIASGVFHLRKPPLVSDRGQTRGAFLCAKFGPKLRESETGNSSVPKLWPAAGGNFWHFSMLNRWFLLGNQRFFTISKLKIPKISGLRIRKPPLFQIGDKQGGAFLCGGAFLSGIPLIYLYFSSRIGILKASGVFHLRMPPLFQIGDKQGGAFLCAKFGPNLRESKTDNWSVLKVWPAAGGKFWHFPMLDRWFLLGNQRFFTISKLKIPQLFGLRIRMSPPPLLQIGDKQGGHS